jgi:hypothetical protein
MAERDHAMKGALLAALIAVESSGNDQARNGSYIGPLQIGPAVVADVNRVYGTRYVHSEMTNRCKAVRVCDLYLSHYVTERTLGRKPKDRDYAMAWNLGPYGVHWYSVKGWLYWFKVRDKMEENK